MADDTVRQLRMYSAVLRQHSIELRAEAQEARQLAEAARKKFKSHRGQEKVVQLRAVDVALRRELPQPD